MPPTPLGHFALAAQEYTHFTSPIRRYPDLIVHRALKWALENPDGGARACRRCRMRVPASRRPPPRSGLTAASSLRKSRPKARKRSARADAAERELMEWKTAQFMESHLGEEYDALIISVQKFGFFVELIEIFVEGLVSIDRLEESTGQRCIYRERDHTIVTEPYRGGAAAPRGSFSGSAIACASAPSGSILSAIESNFLSSKSKYIVFRRRG